MSAAGTSLHFEDFAEGQSFVTSGRTITDADIVLFSGLSGDHTRLHLDEVYARTSTPYGGRVAHGMLGVSIMTGLIAQLGTMHDTAIVRQRQGFRHLPRDADDVGDRQRALEQSHGQGLALDQLHHDRR